MLYGIAVSFKEAAQMKGGEASDVYGKVAYIIVITWIFYPYAQPMRSREVSPLLLP